MLSAHAEKASLEGCNERSLSSEARGLDRNCDSHNLVHRQNFEYELPWASDFSFCKMGMRTHHTLAGEDGMRNRQRANTSPGQDSAYSFCASSAGHGTLHSLAPGQTRRPRPGGLAQSQPDGGVELVCARVFMCEHMRVAVHGGEHVLACISRYVFPCSLPAHV